MVKLLRMNKLEGSEEPEIERVGDALKGVEKPLVRSLGEEYFSMEKEEVRSEEIEAR